MQLRSIPDDFDPEVVAAIDARLRSIALDDQVRIPWAIESGSRAWGFASPDSDYDCRFFFLRSRTEYLDLWPQRDVIETPLEGLLDVNGWDVAKAIKLAVGGNATVGEWLRSPLLYAGDPAFCEAMLRIVGEVADVGRIRRHYLHVGRDQWALASAEPGTIKLKKVFYSIRPAVTLRWLDAHTGVPPMNLDELLADVDLPADVAAELADLREKKSRTRELGTADVPAAIAGWVAEILGREDDREVEPTDAVRRRAQDGFLEIVERWAAGA